MEAQACARHHPRKYTWTKVFIGKGMETYSIFTIFSSESSQQWLSHQFTDREAGFEVVIAADLDQGSLRGGLSPCIEIIMFVARK